MSFVRRQEFSANPLPRSFCVVSLSDFVGDLPDELLLCPVRALRVYLSRVSSVSPRPRSLFLLGLSLRMLLASFFGMASLGRIPLLLHLLLLFAFVFHFGVSCAQRPLGCSFLGLLS